MSPIVIPAPTFRLPDGQLDQVTNARYAAYIAAMWVRHVIVARAGRCRRDLHYDPTHGLVDLWADRLDHDRLMVACWEPHAIQRTLDRQMRPLVMLPSDTREQLLATFANLSRDTIKPANHPWLVPRHR